jgi:hypothetical protein
MADNFEGTYNYYGKFQFITPSHSLGIEVVEIINDIATAKWGWHFIEHRQNFDSEDDAWYKNQRCILSFDNRDDLAQSILMVGNLL